MMRYLKTDEQTMGDLSIFGKPGKTSVYELYHKTVTQGGSELLKELFRHPMSDDKEINQKAAIFRFFSREETVYPIDPETIGTFVYYLSNVDERTQLSISEASSIRKLMDRGDSSRVLVRDGVAAGLRIFYRLGQFIQQLETSVQGSAYEMSLTRLSALVNAAVFAGLRQYAEPGIKVKPAVLAGLDKILRFGHRDQVLKLLDWLYELDVFIAVGRVARERGFHFGKALSVDDGTLVCKQLYHPDVENAIANDLSLNKEGNVLFLTGANMAGKSTFMKSIGIALYLGHMGFPVAAVRLEFSVREAIYTSINLADDLAMGASHFFAEVLRVKEVAGELKEGRRIFVLFDELFRGTNVKDAHEGTIALTRAFSRKSGSQFILSTHIMEAGKELQKEPLSIKYQFLPTEMKGNSPVYTRILREGITADRQGMIIIQNEGILKMLEEGIKKNGGTPMSFITDKQTLTDLNLLGKYKAGSLFNLFNRVKTKGGERLLEEFFRAPLTEAAAINRRAARIRYIQELDLLFGIGGESAEVALHYLTEARPANRWLNIAVCYKEKIQELIYRSGKWELSKRRIQAVQVVLATARQLLEQLQQKEKRDNACGDLQKEMAKIIDAPELKRVTSGRADTVRRLAECRYLLLNKYREALTQLMGILYEFDVYISVAGVATDKGLIYAETNENCLLEVEQLRHPSLPKAVGNTLTLTRDENMLFLTGANMAGKSTWMKALGISFYLAHMGFPIAAGRMRFFVMEGILTSINVPDDLSQGWSHFYAEVMRVKSVAKEVSSGRRLFVLFDELFKGTNVKDAYDATLAVTERLARYRTCTFVISTHIIEVGKELRNSSNIRFGYMPTTMKEGVPHYSYKMAPGITADRQGMVIIENEGILEMLK